MMSKSVTLLHIAQIEQVEQEFLYISYRKSFVMILLFFSLTIPLYANAQKIAGTAIALQGKVTVKTGNAQESRQIILGQNIYIDDYIITSMGSKLKIRLFDENIITIGSNSQVSIQSLFGEGSDNTSLQLWFGKMWINVKELVSDNKAFTVHTNNAIAGVRGTNFCIEFQENIDTSQIWVENGSVELKNETSQVIITAGQYSQIIQKNAPSTPTILSPEEMKDIFKESELINDNSIPSFERVQKKLAKTLRKNQNTSRSFFRINQNLKGAELATHRDTGIAKRQAEKLQRRIGDALNISLVGKDSQQSIRNISRKIPLKLRFIHP